MDLGGVNLVLIEVIGAAVLLLVIAYAVMRTKSTGKDSSNPTTERATRELYQKEDRANRNEEA
ncbi:hypothetical protein [Sphingomonas rhizophila]|uniref:hypothetical protein n=1 Tax=Sphingomonas rhizophila TaxID=2071607 RepID=UPI001FE82A7E|nr:hypothetical protein [Sphingomonas rhizophila]